MLLLAVTIPVEHPGLSVPLPNVEMSCVSLRKGEVRFGFDRPTPGMKTVPGIMHGLTIGTSVQDDDQELFTPRLINILGHESISENLFLGLGWLQWCYFQISGFSQGLLDALIGVGQLYLIPDHRQDNRNDEGYSQGIA